MDTRKPSVNKFSQALASGMRSSTSNMEKGLEDFSFGEKPSKPAKKPAKKVKALAKKTSAKKAPLLPEGWTLTTHTIGNWSGVVVTASRGEGDCVESFEIDGDDPSGKFLKKLGQNPPEAIEAAVLRYKQEVAAQKSEKPVRVSGFSLDDKNPWGRLKK